MQKPFSEHIQESFFVISSDNYTFVKSHLYGIAFCGDTIFHDAALEGNEGITWRTPGCFIMVDSSDKRNIDIV